MIALRESVKCDLQIRMTSRVQVIDIYDRRPDVHSQLIENSILRANSCGLTNPFVRLCPMNGKTTDGRTRQSTIETFAKFLPFSPWHLIFFSRRIGTYNPNLWSFLSLCWFKTGCIHSFILILISILYKILKISL